MADEYGRLHARFIGIGALVGAVTAALAAVVFLVEGGLSEATPSLVGVVLCFAVLGLWRASLSTALVAHVFGVSLSFILILGALSTGEASYLSLFVIVPMATLFLAGRRVGVTWMVVSLGFIAGIGWLLGSGVTGPSVTIELQVARAVIVSTTVFTIGLTYDLLHDRALSTMSQAREVAEAANREKSRFLAKVSHEIRTPLNGVLGTTDLALLEETAPRTRAHLTTIHRSGSTLLALINDLLDLARGEEGRFELANAPFTPARVAAEVVELHRARAEAKGLRLELICEVPESRKLLGDANRLRQVLGNLISNAIKFTRKGRVVVRCEGRPAEQGFKLSLSVQDTGPGIAPTQHGRLFEPFAQLSSEPSEGTGLGLAIARQVIEAMRGQMRFSSEPGKGSTFGFEVTLPLSEDSGDHTPLGTAWRFHGRALVADDNEVNLHVAAGLLERLGLEVTTAVNGQEALDRLADGHFDLVLLDLQMPVLDGLSAARALRARGDRTPIIALTAHALREDVAACSEAGMEECLTKPLRLPRLVELLLRVLPERRQTAV